MTRENKIVVAAAGSGKTTYLVREAIKIKDERVLITTYTESNEAEIRQKFFDLAGCVPQNVHIVTWFKFLITHGVKPFQGGLFEFRSTGMFLSAIRSGLRGRKKNGAPFYWGESDFEEYYFNRQRQIYSDKLSKLVIRCNECSNGSVIDRISRVFPNVFVDEVQDLAGYDLNILVALAASPARLLMVGDPRQVTYLTHHAQSQKKYAAGGIADFLRIELPKDVSVEIDETTLNSSHRNSSEICTVSSRLYPEMAASQACDCEGCRTPADQLTGLFIVQKADFEFYLQQQRPMQLRHKVDSKGVSPLRPVMNFGESKGRGFDHVVILPTEPMKKWLANNDFDLKPESRAKFYVALTRARHSVGIVTNWGSKPLPAGFSLYEPTAPASAA